MDASTGARAKIFRAAVMAVVLFGTISSTEAAPFDPSYAVELTQGPMIAPVNIVGMGGAFVSIAEGAGAQLINPAASANRFPHNGNVWFDWDWALDWLNVGFTDNLDFENNDRRVLGHEGDRFSVVAGALSFYFGRFGIGLQISTREFGLRRDALVSEGAKLPDTFYDVGTIALSGGYNLMDGQLVFGAQLLGAVSGISLRTEDEAVRDQILRMSSGGFAFGGLARPAGAPYRFGVSFSTQMRLDPEETPDTSNGLVLPREMVVPWQLTVGASYSLGSRALNRTTNFGSEEGPPAGDDPERDYVTIAADVVVTGKVAQAAGFEAWVDGELQEAVKHPTVGIRVGIDSEFWPDVMRGRMGFYYEPSRFDEGRGRTHITGGFDVHVGELIWDWRAGAGADVSYRYVNLMLSAGFWY